jgi:L-threonylcarbamoyladenylate synthase
MIEEAARIIRRGGAVVYPTETVYGLGADALDGDAVRRVFLIKERPLSMPVSLAVSSIEMMERVAELRGEDLLLIERLLPGPLTILARRSPIVPEILTAGSPMVGIRFPDHELALRLIEACGPITSTSANLTGRPSPASAPEVSPEIRQRVELVLDGGPSRYAQPSTLLDLATRRIIRPGAGLDRVLKAIS